MASLGLSISVKEEKNSIVITECTGAYSPSNKRGWGGPNYTLAMATKAQFEVYFPEQTNPLIIPVYPEYPSDDPKLGYEVSLYQLGVSYIESGVWKIGYRVFGVDGSLREFSKYTEMKVVFYKNAECCVDKLRATTANVPANVFMKDEKKRAAVELSAIFDDAKWAKECGNFDAAQRSLKFINLQCQCCT